MLAQVHHVAVFAVWAFATHTGIPIRIYPTPGDAESVAVKGRVFGYISRFGEIFPDEKIEQGFITSRGRFLERKEAKILAIENGQVSDNNDDLIFSEDLY